MKQLNVCVQALIGGTVFIASATTAAWATEPGSPPGSKPAHQTSHLSLDFRRAIDSFQAGRLADAYGRFIALANQGHAGGARYALLMCEHGPELFGRDWDCVSESANVWARLAKVPTPKITARHYGQPMPVGIDDHRGPSGGQMSAAAQQASTTMSDRSVKAAAPQDPSKHVAPLAQKELAPVNAAILLTTSLCTGVLTIASEFLGSGFQGLGPYIFAAIWVLAILVIFALIGREHSTKHDAQGLTRWVRCLYQGATVSFRYWQYSLLLLAVAALAGGTSYLNVKRSASAPVVVYADTAIQQLTARGYSLSDASMWMALAEGNTRAIELARAAGRESFPYVNLQMGNALESLVIKGGESALKTLELVRPTQAELSNSLSLSPQHNKLDIVFPAAWNDALLKSLSVRVMDILPARLDAGAVYVQKGSRFVSEVQTTPLMLAIWKGDDRLADKLLSLGADPHIATTFTLMVKTAPDQAGSGMAHNLRFATVTLFPSQEARRLGRALSTVLSEPKNAPKQRLSIQPR